MTQINQHIREFLSYYCGLNTPPEYAVLIKGLWGTGKTWFIQDYLEKLKQEGQDHLYVSLYGVTSFEDIESDFFRQLHPLLSSKSAKLLGKLAKGMVKATIKVDLDDDGQSDGTITAGVPNDKLVESLKRSEGRVLVFDDIERCAIPICDLLGYINQFVEHNEFKAILIANEHEIVEREEKSELHFQAYRRIKEKLVGKTFEIEPDLAPALTHFVDQLQCEKTRSTINENKTLVAQLYNSSKYKNLRILRNALWDFDRLFAKLSSKITENKPLVSHLLQLFLIYSFEIMSGTIFPENISIFRSSLYSSLGRKNGEINPDQKYIDIKGKYSGVDFNDMLFDGSIWQSVLANGIIPLAEIEEAIFNSRYFQSQNQPNWVRLWHARDLEDDEFETVLSAVEVDWETKAYKEVGIVKHIAGLLLWFSDYGLYKNSKAQILEYSKSYVDHLKEQGCLMAIASHGAPIGWAGLGFHSENEEIFIELCKYVKEKEETALLESYAIEAKSLITMMKEEPDKFLRSLVLCNHPDNRFYDVPIFEYITPSDFVFTFMELTPSQRRTVAYVFEERYKFEQFNSKLVGELSCLKEIMSLLKKTQAERQGKMSAHTIGIVIDKYLTNAVKKLEGIAINA